jgi:transcriptional regulator with XRE-family HTH domain
MILSEVIADRIKEERLIKGWSQTNLWHATNLSSSALSEIETGKRIPKLETLIRIADALDLSLDYLCGRDKK